MPVTRPTIPPRTRLQIQVRLFPSLNDSLGFQSLLLTSSVYMNIRVLWHPLEVYYDVELAVVYYHRRMSDSNIISISTSIHFWK